MENTISKIEAIADVIENFPQFHEAGAIYGHSLFQLVDEHDIKTAHKYLSHEQGNIALTIAAANSLSERMNGHSMFVPKLDPKTNVITYEGFDSFNRSCGVFNTDEALACALIMVHGTLGMYELDVIDGILISAFKLSDKKFAQLLD